MGLAVDTVLGVPGVYRQPAESAAGFPRLRTDVVGFVGVAGPNRVGDCVRLDDWRSYEQVYLRDAKGALRYHDLTVSYFNGLLPVRHVDGTAVFADKRLQFLPTGGALKGLKITGGALDISVPEEGSLGWDGSGGDGGDEEAVLGGAGLAERAINRVASSSGSASSPVGPVGGEEGSDMTSRAAVALA